MLLHPHRLGLTVGAFLGTFHVIWSVLVATGLAQPLMTFIMKVHMIDSSARVLTFSLGDAVLLVIVTSLIGYLAGFLFSLIWNRMHRGNLAVCVTVEE